MKENDDDAIEPKAEMAAMARKTCPLMTIASGTTDGRVRYMCIRSECGIWCDELQKCGFSLRQ
jgi:hypothetical protein